MTTELVSNSDMQRFSPAEIKRASELLRCPLDEASAIRALIIQRDTGLSLTRGEISIVPFNGKPTVMVNRQGYLAYACAQPDYDGYESGSGEENGEQFAWCTVHNKRIHHPPTVKIYSREFAKQTPIWREKPRYMLEKTAISLALRAAFPILNGTYSEDEIEPDKITPRPTDITVTPEPVQEPAQEPVGELNKSIPASEPHPASQTPANKPKNIYSKQDVDKIVELYQGEKWSLDIFDVAKISACEWDKDMIMADYTDRIHGKYSQEEKQAAKPEPQPAPAQTQEPKQTKPVKSNSYCQDCGTRVYEDEEEQSMKRFGVPLCNECMIRRLKTLVSEKQNSAPAPAQSAEPAEPAAQNRCTVCGREMNGAEISTFNLFNSGKPLVCNECLKLQQQNRA